MPQITSASYNLGNYRQSSRSNSFNRRNSGELANQQNIIAERLRLVNEAKLLKQKQLANRPKLAILFNPTTYPPDALNLMNFIKDDTSGSRFSIINYTDLATTLEEQYNLGFRFFASPTIGSFELYTYCIPFCNKYQDALLFTTYSTQYFEDGVLPFNIIRSSVNDKDLANYIVNEILYKVNTLTKESAPLYYKPISINTDNTYPIFRKIVYIYTEKDANGNTDTYSEEYGNQLLNAVNLTNGDIEIQLFKILDDNFILPEEVKTLLSANPVSGHDFQYNSKTMFILNSYSPEKILQLFDEEYMYDNYFIFGYVFTSLHYTSKYKFNYAICPLGNYSFEGYKTAGFVPGGRQLSPFLFSICDPILKLIPYYTQIYYKYPNFSSTQFNLYFINRMKDINLFVDDNYWYERKIFTYYIGTKDGDLTNAQYIRDIFYQFKFNPTSSASTIYPTFEYQFLNTNLAPFDSAIHVPVINTSNSFSTLTTESTNNLNATTTVKITFVLANSSSLLGNDGINFNINQTVIDYYKNNTVTITKFSGMPLSKSGEQFANLSNLLISATDTPKIFANTSLNRAFYNCSNLNANISNWIVSGVKNMDSMFENATNFNNNFSPLNWTCNSSLSAINFGKNSSLYGLGGDYNINPGNGVRSNKKTSIETPTKTLTQSNSSLADKSGSFIFTISDLQFFDTTKIPIINSISFISLGVSQNYGNSSNSITVTIVYKYKIILGNDGLSFKDVFSYYGNKQVTISQFGDIPLSRGGEQFANLPNLVISETNKPTILTNTSLNKTFFNSTNFNSNINTWIFSNVTNMTSMFQNATAFNNNNTPMNWTCNSNLVADNFGDGSALYINNGDYILNFGNASRIDGMTSIQTPINKYDGTIVYSFTNTGLGPFRNSLPIINSSGSFSFIRVFQSISNDRTGITIIYNIPNGIRGDDGFSFKNVKLYYQYYGIGGGRSYSNVIIHQFGNVPLSRAGEQFAYLANITILDSPTILPNTSLNDAFYLCTNFNSNISNWNVSNVTNMSSMFKLCEFYNSNLNNWDVSNVTDMSNMFENAYRFNNDNTPMNWNCNDNLIANKFGNRSALYKNNNYAIGAGNATRRIGNQSIQTPIWYYKNFQYITNIVEHLPIITTNNSIIILDTNNFPYNNSSRKISISFSYSNSIQGEDGLSFKNVSTFYNNKSIFITQFDGIPLSNSGEQFANLSMLGIPATDTPTIFPNTSLSKAFYNCTNFNQDISNWNFSGVTNMESMFENATKFNQDISSWNISNVTNMDSMFENATKFSNNFEPMFWNCASLTSAINFGLNSSFYETGESFNINPRNAVRLSSNNIDYYSIETGTNNMSYQLTPAQVTELTTVRTGIFKYKFVKTGLATFDNTKHLPIINKKTFKILVSTNIIDKTMYVEVNFSYRFILGDDGLSFRDVPDYYGSNTVEITDFGGIPLSSDRGYVLNSYDLSYNLSIACTSRTYPTIKNPSSIPSNTIVYFTEINTNGTYTFNNVPSVYNKISVFLVGAGGSGGAGGGDGNSGGYIRTGTDGTGGGGGEFSYIIDTPINNNNFKIVVGKGGYSVQGGSLSNGNDGIDGTNTTLRIPGWSVDDILVANFGGKGYGGHATSSAKDSIGGGYSIDASNNLVEIANFNVRNRGLGTTNRIGGKSGYSQDIQNNSTLIISKLAGDNGILFNNFGDGGNATDGCKVWHANTLLTGPGKDGYARVYFKT